MQCFVYRSSKKEGLYVYMAQENRLDLLPEPLLHQLGKAELALSFELGTRKSMGSEDPKEVLNNLEGQGYHVQIPPKTDSLLTLPRQKHTGSE